MSNPVQHGVELSWRAHISGRFLTVSEPGFADMEDLRILHEGMEVAFAPGESFGIRGRIEGGGRGLHLFQAIDETVLVGPAVIQSSCAQNNLVDRRIAFARKMRRDIPAACILVAAAIAPFLGHLGPAGPVMFLAPIAIAFTIRREMKVSAKEMKTVNVFRSPPLLAK